MEKCRMKMESKKLRNLGLKDEDEYWSYWGIIVWNYMKWAYKIQGWSIFCKMHGTKRTPYISTILHKDRLPILPYMPMCISLLI